MRLYLQECRKSGRYAAPRWTPGRERRIDVHRQFLPWPRPSQGGLPRPRLHGGSVRIGIVHRIFPARGERRGAQRAPGRPSISCCGDISLSSIAPQPAAGQPVAPCPAGHPARVPGGPGPVGAIPGIPERAARPGLPGYSARACSGTGPRLVHLASPFFLGATGQPGRPGGCGCRWWPCTRPTCPGTPGPITGAAWPRAAAWRWLRDIHNAADRTLAPVQRAVVSSGSPRTACSASGCGGRGVDTQLFSPAGPQRLAAPGAGARTAKCWPGTSAGWPRRSRSSSWPGWPGCRGCALVIVGGGPAEPRLRRADAVRGVPRPAIAATSWPASSPALGRIRAQRLPRDVSGRPSRKRRPVGLPVVAPAGRRPGRPGRRRGHRLPWCRPATRTR